jgi:hypothetical protein
LRAYLAANGNDIATEIQFAGFTESSSHSYHEINENHRTLFGTHTFEFFTDTSEVFYDRRKLQTQAYDTEALKLSILR